MSKRETGETVNEQLKSEGETDPRTGTRRLDLWRESAEGGAYGDNARGDAYSSRYVSDNGRGCAEIAVFPVEEEWGWDVCEMATCGAAVTEDGIVRPDDAADVTYEYPHALAIDSLDKAQEIAKRIGSQDYSYALHLRNQEATSS